MENTIISVTKINFMKKTFIAWIIDGSVIFGFFPVLLTWEESEYAFILRNNLQNSGLSTLHLVVQPELPTNVIYKEWLTKPSVSHTKISQRCVLKQVRKPYFNRRSELGRSKL